MATRVFRCNIIKRRQAAVFPGDSLSASPASAGGGGWFQAADKPPLLITGPFSLWWPSLCCLWQTHHFIVTPAGGQTVGPHKPSVMKSTNSSPASSKKERKKKKNSIPIGMHARIWAHWFIHLLIHSAAAAAGPPLAPSILRSPVKRSCLYLFRFIHYTDYTYWIVNLNIFFNLAGQYLL